MYAFKCEDDNKNKLKGISESYIKNNKLVDFKKCLDGEEYQFQCGNLLIR